MCVCVCERERGGRVCRKSESMKDGVLVFESVFDKNDDINSVCVCERGRERDDRLEMERKTEKRT